MAKTAAARRPAASALLGDIASISRLHQRAKAVRKDVDANPKRYAAIKKDLDLVIEQATPTFLFLKASAVLDQAFAVLWQLPSDRARRAESKKLSRTEILCEELGISHAGVKNVLNVRAAILQAASFETDWDMLDDTIFYLSMFAMQLKVLAAK